MISRKANNLVPAKEQLQTLTPAELTEVSGGHGPWGRGGWHHRPHHWHPWGYGQH